MASPERIYYWTTTEGGLTQGRIIVKAYLTLREMRELTKQGVRFSKTNPAYWCDNIRHETSVSGVEAFKAAYRAHFNPFYDTAL